MDCVICLTGLEQATELACGHRFHAECITKCGFASLHDCPACPLCRAPIEAIQVGLDAVKRYNRSGLLLGDIQLIQAATDLGSAICTYTMGNIYFHGDGVDRDYVQASFYWKQTEEIYASSCHNLGLAAKQMGDPVLAAAYFRKAIALSPLTADYVNLAELLGANDESAALYLAALEICEPEDEFCIYILLGKNAYSQHKTQAASEYFEQSLQLKPGNDYARIMAALTSSDTVVAHAHLDAVLLRNATNVDAICLKGQIYVTQRNKAGADEMLRRACKLSPNAATTEELTATLRIFGPITRKRAR